MAEHIHIPDYWQQAKAELSAADPIMAEIISMFPNETLQGKGDAFLTLCRSIVGQQISVKAADSVWAKFIAQVSIVTPNNVIKQSEEELPPCGLSRQKITYLGEIAHYFIHHKADAAFFASMSDEEALKSLTSIKGVGRWTAEMFLMFHLMRPDILPLDDIGLQRGIEKHYNQGEKMIKKQHVEAAEPWKPWRTVATWYLWRSLDPVPVEY